jgi:hypothetical protein
MLFVMLGGVFAAADYFGLFGLKERTAADFFTFRVKTIDAETGQRIDGVVVRCFQRSRQNVCTQKATGRYGEFSFMLPLEKVVLESLLFRHSEVFVIPDETEIRAMYIHPDYQRLTEHYDIHELIGQPVQVHTVSMQRIPALDQDNSEIHDDE